MQDMIVALFEFLFDYIGNLKISFDSIAGSGSTANVEAMVNNVALLIKPIGYSLLGVFALLEFAQLSERVGNVTGFMGAGLVIEVLVKLILAKLVLDNSTQICEFIVTVTDDIASRIGGARVTTVNFARFKRNIENAFPDWWDILGQLAFFIVSAIFVLISIVSVTFVKVVYACRYFELYALSAVSPIPLSTCLSKTFNIAPNFLKNVFAVGLQGGLLMLVIKIFNVIFVAQINGIGTLARNDWGALWGMLVTILLNSLLLLICSFQTQRWAKSICHAM